MASSEEFRGDALPVTFDEKEVRNFPDLITILNGLESTLTATGISKKKLDDINRPINSIKQKQKHHADNLRRLSVVGIFDCDNRQACSTNLLKGELSNYLNLNPGKNISNPAATTLFGLGGFDFKNEDISGHNSSFKLADYVQPDVVTGGPMNPSSSIREVSQDKIERVKMYSKLNEGYTLYSTTLLKHSQLLQQAAKEKSMFIKTLRRCEELGLKKLKLIELTFKILEQELLIQFYSEDDDILPAVNKTKTMLDIELSNAIQECENLKEKRSKYLSLNGTEFNDIIQSCKDIEEKNNFKRTVLQNCGSLI